MNITVIVSIAISIFILLVAIIYLFNKIRHQRLLKQIERLDKLEQERKSIELDRKSQIENKKSLITVAGDNGDIIALREAYFLRLKAPWPHEHAITDSEGLELNSLTINQLIKIGEIKGVDILINEFKSGLWTIFGDKLLITAMGKLKNMQVFDPLINNAMSIGFATMELQHIPFESRETRLVAIAHAIADIGTPAVQPCMELKQKYTREYNKGGELYFEHILGLIKAKSESD